MRILFCLILILVAPFARAFEYRIVPGPLLKPSIVEGHELGRVFARAGYHALSDLDVAGSGLPFDRVFVSEGWKKSFSLKAGLAAPPELEGRPIEAPGTGVIVFHFRYRETPYLLVSQGISRDELKSIVRPWLARSSAKWSWLLPEARAENCGSIVGPVDPLAAFTSFTARVKDDEMVRLIGRCAVDAWSEFEKAPAETLRFFQTLATHPEEIWRQTRDSLILLKDFALDARREMARLGELLSSLSPESRRQLVCTLVGAAVAQGSMAIVGGFTVTKLAPALLSKLKSAVGALEKLGGLEKKGLRLANQRQLTEEVIRCAH